MSLNRRQWLQGITCAGAIGATGEASAFASRLAKSRASGLIGRETMPMPRDLGSPVTESLRPVIENSRDVHTHYDKIVEVAGWMAYEDLPMPNLAIPYGLEKTPDIAMDFVMVGNTIDTAFTDFKTHVKFQVDYAGEHHSDSDAMFACLKRAMDNGIPILDGKFLATITRQDMNKIFAGNIEMPM